MVFAFSKAICDEADSSQAIAVEDAENKLFFNYFARQCDVGRSAYTNNLTVGYLEKLLIDGKEIKADTLVRDPEDPSKQIAATAILESVCWDGQSFYLRCRISPQVKASLLEALCPAKPSVIADAQWVVYEYDYMKQRYFRSFHTNNKAISLSMPDRMASVDISEKPESEGMPINFLLRISFTPANEEQKIFFSFQADGPTFFLPIVHQ
jgi:hypothetical protein